MPVVDVLTVCPRGTRNTLVIFYNRTDRPSLDICPRRIVHKRFVLFCFEIGQWDKVLVCQAGHYSDDRFGTHYTSNYLVSDSIPYHMSRIYNRVDYNLYIVRFGLWVLLNFHNIVPRNIRFRIKYFRALVSIFFHSDTVKIVHMMLYSCDFQRWYCSFQKGTFYIRFVPFHFGMSPLGKWRGYQTCYKDICIPRDILSTRPKNDKTHLDILLAHSINYLYNPCLNIQ